MNDDRVGVVVIGRNEGQRLVRALDSVCDGRRPVVYADSGSTDGSSARAAARGAVVVELDPSQPYTAARGRNAGFDRLRADHPEVELVQFVDGDCEVEPGWIATAASALERDPRLAAVCGYLRERSAERSFFGRICEVEWHLGPVGPTTSFGGNVMIRASALEEVGGWDPRVIAAEDDELALRLGRAGYELLRLDAESMVHDADMHHLGQWWRRATRAGYAYAQVSSLHGAAPERKFVREKRRALVWGLAVPVAAALLAPFTLGLSVLPLARYPVVGLRVAWSTRKRGFPVGHAVAWGVSCALSPFPEAIGAARYHARGWLRGTPGTFEKKGEE